MLGVAGILGQEILNPDVFWYSAGLPENIPNLDIGGQVNLAGLLAWEFLLMHFVEVRAHLMEWMRRCAFLTHTPAPI